MRCPRFSVTRAFASFLCSSHTLKQLGIAKLMRTTQTFKNSKFSSKIEQGGMSFTVKNVSIKGALQSDCMVKRYRFYIKNSWSQAKIVNKLINIRKINKNVAQKNVYAPISAGKSKYEMSPIQ